VNVGTIEQLPAYARAEDTLLVMDANTEEAAGPRVRAALPGASEHVFAGREGLLAGIAEVEAVRAYRAPMLVAVGSGVITDIVRYAAHLSDRQFVSVPTAASMDGYASSVAALQVDGVKVTYPARAPIAILADPRVVAAAPAELTRAGIGDLLAKATARVDWLASHLLYGEPFNDEAASMVLEPLTFAVDNVERLVAGDLTAVSELLRGLIQSGMAIAVAGSSRPASGCEHHASHFWDLLAAHGRRPHESHGLQVGYASHFAMRLQEYAFGGGVETLSPPMPVADPLGPAAQAWLGEPTAELRDAVAGEQRFIAASPDRWPARVADWPGVCGRLAPALALFPGVHAALERAGIPDEPGFLGVDAELLTATFHYASRLRARYTVIDFLEGQRVLDQAVAVSVEGHRVPGRFSGDPDTLPSRTIEQT
jgi:glycerol-1-phosphate dehydrogenase [NAD(P)+]